MTQVLSFISRKGGSGKTTNAINLATTLQNRRKKVMLLETDTNYTLNSLRKLELFKKKITTDNNFPIVGSEDNLVASEIEILRKRNVALFHEGKCCRCGLPLTNPLSISRGLGDDCYRRYIQRVHML